MSSLTYGRAPELSEKRKRELIQFIERCKVPIRDLSLLNLAFTHRSYANEHSSAVDNNERLEFLGDSVLSVSVANWLFVHLPKTQEGQFSKIRAVAVGEESLAQVARIMDIGPCLLMSRGEILTGGRDKDALLADCVEAIFAACYLDSGFEAARAFILSYLVPQIEKVVKEDYHKDFKTALQEYVQAKTHTVPTYELVKKSGPEHSYTFFVVVHIKEHKFGPATGSTIKKAQQKAAKMAYDSFGVAQWEERRSK